MIVLSVVVGMLAVGVIALGFEVRYIRRKLKKYELYDIN